MGNGDEFSRGVVSPAPRLSNIDSSLKIEPFGICALTVAGWANLPFQFGAAFKI